MRKKILMLCGLCFLLFALVGGYEIFKVTVADAQYCVKVPEELPEEKDTNCSEDGECSRICINEDCIEYGFIEKDINQ